MSDSATTASTDVSSVRVSRTGCSRWTPPMAGESRTRSFCPSLTAPSRPLAPSAAMIALISSGVAPRSRSVLATLSPFFIVMVRSLAPVPPEVWLAVFGSSVTFSGTRRTPIFAYGSSRLSVA